MKKFTGFMKKRGSDSHSPESFGRQNNAVPQGDSPEAVVVREATAFCEAGAPNSAHAGEEYIHLPAIVDATESSPTAAREAANCIKRYLAKDNFKRPFAQYNAVMLLRILTDNPGRDFTQHFDTKFISTLKELLRDCRDASVQQLLRETLDYFEAEKMPGNETLGPLIEMWRKEKGKTARLASPGVAYPNRQPFQSPPVPPRPRALPPPEELAGRIEEAKTTARLLVQTVQSTPQHELMANELVREFADRARLANQSLQTYMACDNPAPDADTMLTLIETNDQLNIAMSKHHRAILQARKAMGVGGGTPSPQPQAEPNQNTYFPPSHQMGQNVYGQQEQNQSFSPPPRQTNYSSDFYTAPSGPPPSSQNVEHRSHDFAYTNAYSAPPARQPSPLRQEMPVVAPPASQTGYHVAENPFSDEAYVEPQRQPPFQRNSSLLLDRDADSSLPQPPVSRKPPPPQPRTSQNLSPDTKIQYGDRHQIPPRPIQRTMSSELYDDDDDDDRMPPTRPSGPGTYNAGFQPTPSFNHRQETAAATLTMSGGSPPPANEHDPISERQQAQPQELDSTPSDDLSKRVGALKV